MLHIYLIVSFTIFLFIFLILSSYVTSRQKTENLLIKVTKWKKLLSEPKDKSIELQLQKLIKSDIDDLEHLLQLKLQEDDKKRDNLNKRKKELPSKAMQSVARAAIAYKLNKK